MSTRSNPLPKPRRNPKDWIIIIAIAVIAHLAFFVFFKPQYLRIFKTEITGEDGNSSLPSLDRPFSLVPLHDQSEVTKITINTQTSEESQPEKFILDELGKPSTDLLLLEMNSRSGSTGFIGPRRATVEPKPLFIPWPKYPDEVKETVEGNVDLLLYVNAKGEVEEVKVDRGLPYEILNRVAIDSAWNIRFTPGLERGVPTSMWVRLTIGFQPR